MATILMRRRWRWIGHVARQEASIAKTAMHWTPEGKRKRGRPKITWRRTVEKEIKEMGKTWEGIKFMARDRQMWREHVAALHACWAYRAWRRINLGLSSLKLKLWDESWLNMSLLTSWPIVLVSWHVGEVTWYRIHLPALWLSWFFWNLADFYSTQTSLLFSTHFKPYVALQLCLPL